MIQLVHADPAAVRDAGAAAVAKWWTAAAEAAAPSPAAARVLVDSWVTDALAGRVIVLEAWNGPTLLGRVLAESFGDGLSILAAQRAALGPRLALPVPARARSLGPVSRLRLAACRDA